MISVPLDVTGHSRAVFHATDCTGIRKCRTEF